MSRQLRRGIVFEAGGHRSHVLREVAPAGARVRRYRGRGEPLVEGVRVVPFDETLDDEEQSLLAGSPARVEETQERFFGRLFEAICEHIEDRWKTDKPHVLFHSSGWDSRIVAWAVRALARKRGSFWLGRLMIVTFGPEADEAEQMLKYEGWEQEQMVIVREPERWLYPAMSLSDLKGVVNGAHITVPVSRYGLVVWLAREGRLPPVGEVQVLSGFGSDYFLVGAAARHLWQWARREYHAATAIPLQADEILPWLGFEVLRVAEETTAGNAFNLRPAMVAWLDRGLAEFRRVGGRWPDFPDGLLERAAREYEQSWYGQACAPGASSLIRKNADWSDGTTRLQRSEWWGHWTAACWCEETCRTIWESG